MARRRNLLPMTRIAEMRYYYSKGRRISELAAHFGVHESVASDIFHGRTHRMALPAEHLPPLRLRPTPEEAARRAEWAARMARRLGGPSGDGWGVAL